jgi:hypothetical protein
MQELEKQVAGAAECFVVSNSGYLQVDVQGRYLSRTWLDTSMDWEDVGIRRFS